MNGGGARVRLDAISKRFGATLAVDSVSLTVEPGEFLTLLGPSGCGKTTTLGMVAGLAEPTAGRILIDDEDVTPSGSRVWLTFAADRLAVLPAGPAEVEG